MEDQDQSRIKIQNSRTIVREILSRADGLPSDDIWTLKARWLAHTDEDHTQGVQCVLLSILEDCGEEILDYAASVGKVERFHVAIALSRRLGYSGSRVQSALRRWARGAEWPQLERELADALGENETERNSACVLRGAA